MSIGGGGFLDTNKLVALALPKRLRTIVTPRPIGIEHASFNVIATPEYRVWQFVSPTPTNANRTTIGVGEEIDLFFAPTLPLVWNNKVVWNASSGSVSPITNIDTRFTAPSNKASVSITTTIGKVEVKWGFDVVEPTGIASAKITSTNLYAPGSAGAGMHVDLVLGPTNVSFYKVKIFEVGQSATNVTGYFTNHWPGPHDTAAHANEWHPIGYDNVIGDNMDNCYYAGTAILPSPWSPGGTFTWPIPALWRVGNGPSNSLPWSDQVFSIDSSGTFTISKFGRSVRRTTQNVITTN